MVPSRTLFEAGKGLLKAAKPAQRQSAVDMWRNPLRRQANGPVATPNRFAWTVGLVVNHGLTNQFLNAECWCSSRLTATPSLQFIALFRLDTLSVDDRHNREKL